MSYRDGASKDRGKRKPFARSAQETMPLCEHLLRVRPLCNGGVLTESIAYRMSPISPTFALVLWTVAPLKHHCVHPLLTQTLVRTALTMATATVEFKLSSGSEIASEQG